VTTGQFISLNHSRCLQPFLKATELWFRYEAAGEEDKLICEGTAGGSDHKQQMFAGTDVYSDDVALSRPEPGSGSSGSSPER